MSRPTLARPCEGVHWGRSLMQSSLLLQQSPACLIRLIWVVLEMGVLEMGGRWPYSCCFVGYCYQDLFNIALSILVKFSFFSMCLVSVLVVHPYYSTDTTNAWKILRFILSDRSDCYMIDSLSIAVHANARCILTSLSVDETLLPRYVNLSTNIYIYIYIYTKKKWINKSTLLADFFHVFFFGGCRRLGFCNLQVLLQKLSN